MMKKQKEHLVIDIKMVTDEDRYMMTRSVSQSDDSSSIVRYALHSC